MVRLFALGSLSAPLSIVLLVAPALAMGIISFRVHRVLEPVFHDTFTSEAGHLPGTTHWTNDATHQGDPESPNGLPHRPVTPLYGLAARRGFCFPIGFIGQERRRKR